MSSTEEKKDLTSKEYSALAVAACGAGCLLVAFGFAAYKLICFLRGMA